MPESGKRVIVDGVDYAQLVWFPRILGSVTAALQPGRLTIALLMVVGMLTLGRIWDALATPRVDASGLRGGLASESEMASHQATLRAALLEFAADNAAIPADDDARLSTSSVVAQVKSGYRARLDGLATDQERARLGNRVQDMLHTIEASRPKGAFEATATYAGDSIEEIVEAMLELRPIVALGAAGALVVDLPRLLWLYVPWFLVIYGLIFIAIFAVGGGALSRMAAMQFAQQQRLSMNQAIDFALARWARLISAQLLPLLVAGGLCVPILLIGLIISVPVIDVIAGIAYGLLLLVGLAIAFLVVGYVLGFPLLVPAVACENCDGADAMQRAYAYVAGRPLHLLGYLLIALIGLALGFLLVNLLAALAMDITGGLVATGSNSPAEIAAGGYDLFNLTPDSDPQHHPELLAAPWYSRWTAYFIQFWQAVVVFLVASYVISFHFDAATRLYLLMRRASDGQDIEEVWQPSAAQGATVMPAADSVDAQQGTQPQ